MARTGFFFTCNLLLPVALHHAFHLPTGESPAWDPPLSSAPRWPLLEGLSEEPFPSILPAVAQADPSAHEVSSGDENWGDANPTIHAGASLPMMTFSLPGVTTSDLRTSVTDSKRSILPQLPSQSLPPASDFTLPTRDPSIVQSKPQDFGPVTLELGPEERKDGPSFSTSALESASLVPPEMASLPAPSGLEASDLSPSQEETTHDYQPDLLQGVSSTFTQSPKPSVSTILLATVLPDKPHMKGNSTEGSALRSDTSVEPWQNRIPEQEQLGRNMTTVKYVASYQSTQVYDGPKSREELSSSPFGTTEAIGYTQTPSGSQRDSGYVVPTSRAPQTTVKAVSSGGKEYRPATVSKDSPPSASEKLSTRSSIPSPAGTTLGPVSHQRNTHWGLITGTTQQAGPWDAAVTKRTPPAGSPGTGEEADVDVQRVRGAVIPRVPVIYVASSTPGQGSSVMKNNSRSKHADVPGTRPPGWSSTVAPATSARLPASPRRGLIRVTTQRALQSPQLAKPEPSLPAMLPVTSPPCPRPGGACSQLLSNQTLLRWGNLERTLSFAWALHVYGAGLLFLLLSLLSLACLGGSLALRVPHLLNAVGASTLLLVFGMLRAIFFLVDPYGSRGWLPARAVRVLYTAPFPLLLSTFVVLLLRLLCQARLQVLPPKWQSLPLWAVLASVQSVVLLGADLLSPPMHSSVPVGLHTLSCLAGVGLLPATVYIYWQIRSSTGTEGALEPGVWSGAWVLLASSGLALPCCGLQFYGVLWISGLLGPVDVFTWGWWFVQFWFRMGEIALSFALAFLAWQALCQRYGSAEHSCWAKLMRYFCTYRKADTPEYPNNCYDWTGSILEKAPNNDISKSLIRNAPGSGRIWALKDSNELRAAVGQGSSPSPSRPPIYGPKCPNAAAAAMGRSYTSICFERDSIISLAELEFRPPSPINLSRSIDEALFREHLVRDSIFLRSSLHFPSRLARQDSCSSLRGDCSTRSHTAQPLLSRPRRSSDPDCLYSLARASSMGELTTQSRALASEPPTDTSFDSFSHTSFSRASLKISWNPWRHGLSSPESLPPEELPGQGQMMLDELPQASSNSAPNSEREARKSFLALSKQVDSRSLSSDTIEL